jgi:coenzyme F420-dependent glucose-6-phosphate dehydrogenase
MEALAAQLPLERAASRWLVSNDPEEHVEQIAPYVEMGFSHLVFHAPTEDQARFIELYGREILPRLRARWG